MGKLRNNLNPRAARPSVGAAVRTALVHLTIGLLLLGGLGAAYWFARLHVEGKLAFTVDPPRIILLNRPGWMSDAAAEELIRALRPATGSSAFDTGVLQSRAAIARASPWVKRVRSVRRAFHRSAGDVIEVDCEYRAPLAVVHWQDYFWLVDEDAYKLPEQYTLEQIPALLIDRDRRTQLRIIENVAHPPVESGRKWPGEDLSAGLELARLLHGQRFADEIVKIDVANFAGRVDPREAQLTLITKYGTEIRWGRPISAKDAFVEVPPARKLEALAEIFQKFHRIDANQPWLDIRYDQITYPSAHVDGPR
ncbi:MAG: hypothetical protein NZ561_02180 [Phycisphaerae bacterium]|nr:hypothetical protein [Phycisphaerae bacterium]MDW8261917.1 hypothetical protein [Phycisphaerales bacterium]